MKKYIDKLEKINSDVYYNMDKASQKIIDITEDFWNLDIDDDPITLDYLGSLSYELSLLLEIWNPSLEYDIMVLKNLNDIISEWIKEIEFINKTLSKIR